MPRCDQGNVIERDKCAQDYWRTAKSHTSTHSVGLAFAAQLGPAWGHVTGGASRSGLGVDLLGELYFGRRGLGYGGRIGYLANSGDGEGYHGWEAQPLLYYVPIAGAGIYAGPGLVLGTVTWKPSGSNVEQSRGATGLRLLAGLKVDVLRLGSLHWTLATELSYVHAGKGDDGPGYSGTALTFGGILSF